MDTGLPGDGSSNDQAEQHFKKGSDLKARGHFDAALTEFRRAALLNPQHALAHFEIGRLCKMKAKADGLFARYSYDAFQKAARLDLANEEAHVQYIIEGQKLGRLDELLLEYRSWSEKNPENELMQRCVKNIIALSMALVPEKVNVSGAGAATWRRVLVIGSLGMVLFGLALVFLPPLISRFFKQNIQGSQLKHFVQAGLALVGFGGAGMILSSRLK